MSKEDVDRIGKGRVWTGNQAKGLNLIDDIGGLSKAIEMAKELSGVAKEEDVRLVVWPKKVSLFASLFRRREAAVKAPLPREFQQTLEWTSLLNQERIWALMPLGRTLD